MFAFEVVVSGMGQSALLLQVWTNDHGELYQSSE
jgi:hypothetical protein